MSTGFVRDTDGILWIYKSPEGKLRYTFNLKDPADPWLATADTLAAAEFLVPAGITKESESFDGTTATVRLSGGMEGADYHCLLTWTDSAGNTDSRAFVVKVRRR